MSPLADNVRAFLDEVRFATIATTNRDGSPHLTALWYALRGDTIVLNTGTTSKKVRNLKRDNRASVCVVDAGQARHVTLEGTVRLDDSRVMEDLTELASRYAGAQAGPGIAANIAKNPHVSLVLNVDRVKTFGKI
ncbi:MAG: PPOX class F420-dependent oxidoreductase [Chloroflexi bacterium]|nr:PPOX class F420-dependent oxidoreductase [Chloroflexota bacterium]MBV9898309.1 PPOX class F420-dependent oxidoreductase [Chloroflexota bacterium]